MNEMRWKSIGRRDEMPEQFPSEIKEALARIGRTDDGKQLTAFLFNAYVFHAAEVGLSDGALREYAATQRLARRILHLLQGEMNDDRDRNSADRPKRGEWARRVLRIAGLRV